MEKTVNHNAVAFFLALIFSIGFTLAILYATIELPKIINKILINYFPDLYKISEFWSIHSLNIYIGLLKFYGFISLAIVIILIIIGFILRMNRLVVLSSVAMQFTLFGYFAFTMFVFAGIGIIRLIWLPIVDYAPWLMGLGNITLLPLLIVSMLTNFIGDFRSRILFMRIHSLMVQGLICIGAFIFFMGTFTWLYGKFRGKRLIDFWIYGYIRHPQYLGILIYSYAILILAPMLPYPRGGYFPIPTLPWLIASMLILTSALFEEIDLMSRIGDKYRDYMKRTSFIIPLPSIVKKIILLPVKTLFGKNYPERRIEVLIVILLYTLLLILLSVPFINMYP